MPRSQHEAWEAIAQSFDRTRTRAWPHVGDYLRPLRPGSRVLDLMAGNGRHTRQILQAGLEAVWVDWSRPAARIAAARCPEAAVLAADATRLPLRDASFDACIFVAGLHSVPTAEGRAQCLRELHRVLRPQATAQVTVWSRDAPRFRRQGVPDRPLDIVLPWRSDGHDEMRQYHLYTSTALRDELERAGFAVDSVDGVAIVAEEVDNLVAVARRAG